jgi:hypothetical protein
MKISVDGKFEGPTRSTRRPAPGRTPAEVELRKVEQLPDGRLSLVYGIGGD